MLANERAHKHHHAHISPGTQKESISASPDACTLRGSGNVGDRARGSHNGSCLFYLDGKGLIHMVHPRFDDNKLWGVALFCKLCRCCGIAPDVCHAVALKKYGFPSEGDRFCCAMGGRGREGEAGEANHKAYVTLEMVMALVHCQILFLDFRAKYFFCLITEYEEFLKKQA